MKQPKEPSPSPGLWGLGGQTITAAFTARWRCVLGCILVAPSSASPSFPAAAVRLRAAEMPGPWCGVAVSRPMA